MFQIYPSRSNEIELLSFKNIYYCDIYYNDPTSSIITKKKYLYNDKTILEHRFVLLKKIEKENSFYCLKSYYLNKEYYN